jgi:hypothetical protein
MRTAQIAAASPAVNRSQKKQQTLSFRRRHKEEIVGTADSLTKAKDLAHADSDLARGAEARR